MAFYGEIDVNAQDQNPKMGGAGAGGGGGQGSQLPGSYTGGAGIPPGVGGGAGGADPTSAGSLPIFEWLKSGADKAGGVMGPVGMGMDAFSMAAAPQQQAIAEAKAGSMAAHQRTQEAAWQSPEYMEWARQIWGG